MQSRIGPYELQGEIGRGGMGVVHRGRDTKLDRTVAIKALPEELAQDPDRLARFDFAVPIQRFGDRVRPGVPEELFSLPAARRPRLSSRRRRTILRRSATPTPQVLDERS